MELNFLNEKLNVDVEKYHTVNQRMFWQYYCQMLNLRNPTLSDKDCILLSYLIAGEYSNFSDTATMKDVSSLTGVAVPNLYNKYKQFVEKGFLVRTEEGIILHPSLARFKTYVKHQVAKRGECDIKFSIPFNIKET